MVIFAYDDKGEVAGFGSGVVLPDGSVATNCHVLEKADSLRVGYQDQQYPATRKHSDRDRDTCTLVASGLKAPPVTLGTTKNLKVGARVYAVGAPQGLTLTLSEGIVSSLRPVDGGQYIQTTTPISPGSSGGGLFDANGRLLGLTSFYMAEGQNLNFALPVEWINELPKRQAAQKKKSQAAGKTTVEWLNQAVVLEKKKDWQGLRGHALRWTKAEPKNAVAWFSLGNAYREFGKQDKAIEAYQQALRINPEHASAWNNLGVAYVNSGKPDKAIEALQQALRINPEDADAWNNLGVEYVQSGKLDKAIEVFQQALRINQEYAKAWYGLGVAYRDFGQTGKVMEVYRRLQKIDRDMADEFFNKIVLP